MHAPTGAARWFNKLDTDFKTSSSSVVQMLDIADMEGGDLYYWWINQTKPKHPVLADPRREVLQQIGIQTGWPNVVVLGCDGSIKFSRQVEMGEAVYQEVRAIITLAASDSSCMTLREDAP